MKAIGLFGQKYVNVEKREYELGGVGPNDALVEVKASGVCGTDLNFMRDSTDGFHPMGLALSPNGGFEFPQQSTSLFSTPILAKLSVGC